jgi:hypothetical protein
VAETDYANVDKAAQRERIKSRISNEWASAMADRNYKTHAEQLADSITLLGMRLEIREWADRLMKPYQDRHASEDSTNVEVPKENWLPFFEELEGSPPRLVKVCFASANEGLHVAILWGSGATGPYGVLVGRPDFKPLLSSGSYFIKWDHGVYVFTTSR